MEINWKTVIVAGTLLNVAIPTSAYAEGGATRGLMRKVPMGPAYEEPVFKMQKNVLPAIPARESSEQLSKQVRFMVNEILLEGNSVLDKKELEEMVKPYTQRFVNMSELHYLRKELSKRYFEKGYVNSGVLIPDQDINDGVVRLQIVEGELSEIKIVGNDHLKESYIANRIRNGITDPLNYGDLQTALRVFEQNGLIGKVNGKLQAGKRPGESVLALQIKETTPYSLMISADNHRAPTVGAEQLNLIAAHNNLTGYGDGLQLSLSSSEGLDSGSISYDIPVNSYDTVLTLSYSQSSTAIVEESALPVGAEVDGSSSSMDVMLSHPFYRDGQSTWNGYLSLSHKESESVADFIDLPTGTKQRAFDLENTTSEASLGTGYIWRSTGQVFALFGTFKFGIDGEIADQTIADLKASGDEEYIPEEKFKTFVGQLQYAMLIPQIKGRFIARSTFQASKDPLSSTNKFAIGGNQSVRGYRENQFVRDSGISANLELRIPLWQADSEDKLHLQIAPFIDYGHSKSKNSIQNIVVRDDTVRKTETELISAGLGLLWDPTSEFTARLYWGEALNDLEIHSGDDDLQDDGLHIHMAYSVPF